MNSNLFESKNAKEEHKSCEPVPFDVAKQQQGNESVLDKPLWNFDSRQIRLLDRETFWYWHQIGVLRMNCDNGKQSVGTATVFFIFDYKNKDRKRSCYAITAGHNLLNWDSMEHKTVKATKIWFERYVSKRMLFWNTKELGCIETYVINNWWIHPNYIRNFKQKSPVSYDVAIVEFTDEKDNFFDKNKNKFWKLPYETGILACCTSNSTKINSVTNNISESKVDTVEIKSDINYNCNNKKIVNLYVAGFPFIDGKDKQLLESFCLRNECNMKVNGTIIHHKMDTTEGQSGSAICSLNYEVSNSMIDWHTKNIKKQIDVDIVGIHSTGAKRRKNGKYESNYNCGSYVTNDLKQWIKETVQHHSNIDNTIPISFGANTHL